MPPILELRNISKSFGSVQANNDISLSFEKGEIHALLGENGAGKTTLMNILYGLYQPDHGDILINGQKVQFTNPGDAIDAGLGMVHQHFMLASVMTVTENIIAGDEMLKLGFILDKKSAAKRIKEIADTHNLEVDPDSVIKDLPVGIQQRVEILKLLFRNADILIFDEPTAVLTPQETEKLILILKSLAADGKMIIFISHKLKEVLEIADKISVLRLGKVVATTVPEESTEESLASLMVGRQVMLKVEKEKANPGEDVLTISDLKIVDDLKHLAVDDISFNIREGEILGVAGVQGNGQTELVEAITGLREILQGKIKIGGLETTRFTPRKITELGVGHVPEDRQRDGLTLSTDLATNLVLNTYYLPPFSKGIVLNEEVIKETAQERISAFDIRTTGSDAHASALSGGNQQKVIIAREFSRPLKLLIASQPTRGLDVGSIEYVHQQIVKKRDEGTAVLLVSTELDEIMSLSDRIAVMFRGQIVGIMDADEVSREELGLMMAGATVQQENLPEGI